MKNEKAVSNKLRVGKVSVGSHIRDSEFVPVRVQIPAASNAHAVWRNPRPWCNVELRPSTPKNVEAWQKFVLEGDGAAERKRSHRECDECFNSYRLVSAPKYMQISIQ